jgi:hypothetical protein
MLNKFIIGWDNCYWTFIRWYEAIFEIDNWELSLWCFWDDFSRDDCPDRFKR